jgi:hypothetical protein
MDAREARLGLRLGVGADDVPRPKTRISRPCSRASALISAIWSAAVSRRVSPAKIRSLWRAAKRRPAGLVPAFITTG